MHVAYLEVVLPTLWNLQQLPNASVDLYRDQFRPGVRQALNEWFTGTSYAYDTFFEQDLSKYHTVFLTTGDRESAGLFDRKIFQAYPHLKVVAIAHWVQRYKMELIPPTKDKRAREFPLATHDVEDIRQMMRDKRWQILCLSPHVSETLRRELSLQTDQTHARPSIETFIPVSFMPQS